MRKLATVVLVFIMLFAIGCEDNYENTQSNNGISEESKMEQENVNLVTPKGYEGMKVEQYNYGTLEDFSGNIKEYSLDIIMPMEKAEGSRPVIIFLHGGGLCAPSNNREWYVATLSRYFVENGYVVVAPNYPVYDDHAQHSELGGYKYGVKKVGNAVQCAYEFLKDNDKKFNIDMKRVAIMGVSAGSMAGFYVIDTYPEQYRMFVSFWGETVHTVRNWEKFPPVLSIHGTEDEVVPYKSAEMLEKRLEKYGVVHELVSLEGALHTPMKECYKFMPIVMKWLNEYMK